MEIIMTLATRDTETCELTNEELSAVVGGRELITIIGCTTPWPAGGYPPGTILWNPWLSPRPIIVS
jgi:bacteriocin-like protein